MNGRMHGHEWGQTYPLSDPNLSGPLLGTMGHPPTSSRAPAVPRLCHSLPVLLWVLPQSLEGIIGEGEVPLHPPRSFLGQISAGSGGPDWGQGDRATDHSASVLALCSCELQITFEGFGHPCKVWNVGIVMCPTCYIEALGVQRKMQETTWQRKT